MKEGAGRKLFIVIVVAVVLASVIGGLLMLGSPGRQRAKKLDERRISQLKDISQAVDLYWTRHQGLPPDLAVLGKESGIVIAITDPASGRPYSYRKTGTNSYELCAVFATVSSGRAGLWAHGRGPRCFKIKVRSVNR